MDGKRKSTRANSGAICIGIITATLGLLTACQPVSPSKKIASTTSELQRFAFRERHLGTQAGLVFYAQSEEVANRAGEAAYDKVRQLDRVFSSYRQDSEIQQLCDNPQANTGVTVSRDLWNVLTAAKELSRQADGAFDVTVGPVARLWKRAIRQRTAPDPTRLAQAMQSVGHDHLQMDEAKRQVTLDRPGMQIDLAAIAKGYIADEMLAVLRNHSCPAALVDLGGDLAIGDPPPEKSGWTVAMATGNSTGKSDANENKNVSLHNCGLATSGDAFQFVEIDGKRYSHIVDPRTGQATTESLTVTVISVNAMLADGLASAVSVLGAEAGLKLARTIPESEVSVLPSRQDAKAANPTRIETDGFPSHE